MTPLFPKEISGMKTLLAVAASALLLSASASAQTPAPAGGAQPGEPSYYVNGLIEAALGDVQSQSFSVEVGVKLQPKVDAFIEVGRIRDTAPASLGENAQIIVQYVAQVQSGLTYQVKQPVTTVQAGIRYGLPKQRGQFLPYLVVGGGMARVTRGVTFSVGRNDITDRLDQYGVTLGSDLSGDVTKGMVTVGGGVEWNHFQPFFIGLDYRYGHIFDSPTVSVNRAGISIGVKF
jgi:opacity protein-like surface antigen